MLFQARKETRRPFLFSILGPLHSQITLLQNCTSLRSWRNSWAQGTFYAGQNFTSAHPLPFERLPRKLHNFGYISNIFLATLFCHIKSGRQTGQIAIIGFRNVIFSDLSRTQHYLKRKRCSLNVLFSHYNPSKQSY